MKATATDATAFLEMPIRWPVKAKSAPNSAFGLTIDDRSILEFEVPYAGELDGGCKAMTQIQENAIGVAGSSDSASVLNISMTMVEMPS
jgi:hypothetical protein